QALGNLADTMGINSSEWRAIGPEAAEQVEIQAKFEGYIRRQSCQAEQASEMESVLIPEDIDFGLVRSISHEGREKLARIRPRSLGQAARIPGIRPGDIRILYVYLHREAAAGSRTPVSISGAA
ncbi:MAG TPA: hypothetical protein VGS41_08885, partial [Chthonomonadales bacterium]|nr:hypothetical protein [Chthonomonadales bacterium]